MSALADVMMWAQRVMSRSGVPAHQILDLPATATADQAQEAFHRIARMAHPDLHRRSLSPEDFDILERAYARAAGAYQDFRTQTMRTTRMRPIQDAPAAPAASEPPSRATPAPAPRTSTAPPAPGVPAMNTKAQLYYRKAEMCLRAGDLKGAVLQLKMACAGDPASSFLRTALAEVQAELAKS